MTENSDARPQKPAPAPEFRWQSLFRRCDEPLFLLNRQRRILFVNPAWEVLTGIAAENARGLVCRRRGLAAAGEQRGITQALSPPPEAIGGKPIRVRRTLVLGKPGPISCEIDFLPLLQGNSLLAVLGKLRRLPDESGGGPALPERLLTLRHEVARHYSAENWESKCPAWRLVVNQIRLAAHSGGPGTIRGEPGAGKRWVARAIHCQDPTRRGPFVSLDCARLPAQALTALIEDDSKILRSARFGTLYLREPQRLPRDVQQHLCDWIDDSDEPTPRILAGCSTELEEVLSSGLLIEELYCALAATTIVVPPLRERLPDLTALAEALFERLPPTDLERRSLTPAAWDLLHRHRWPGNLTELLAVLRSAAGRAANSTIDVQHLPNYLRRAAAQEPPAIARAKVLPLDSLLQEVERRMIVLALRQAQGNKSQAAELLSIWRPRLLRRMQFLGIADQS
jgi:transcriptional regulator with PAS, ATPase and Fis domain